MTMKISRDCGHSSYPICSSILKVWCDWIIILNIENTKSRKRVSSFEFVYHSSEAHVKTLYYKTNHIFQFDFTSEINIGNRYIEIQCI